jgi:hypothetical protein
MSSRSALAFATLAFIAVTGCDVGNRIPGVGDNDNDVLLRVVNTTGSAIDLTTNGQVVGGSGHVNAGTASSCIHVDPAVTTTLGLREAGSPTDLLVSTPTLTAGAIYTVVAFTSDAGSMQAYALADEFTLSSGLAAIRVLHVAPGLGSLDVYVTPRAGPLGVPSTASIGYGGNTGFFDTEPGPTQVRFTVATTSTLVFDAGFVTLSPGELATVVLAQPAGPAGAPTGLIVPAC